MSQLNSLYLIEAAIKEKLETSEPGPEENPGIDPQKKPEVEPEVLPKENPGEDPQTAPDDDDEEDDPFSEREIGDDPDEIQKKTTVM